MCTLNKRIVTIFDFFENKNVLKFYFNVFALIFNIHRWRCPPLCLVACEEYYPVDSCKSSERTKIVWGLFPASSQFCSILRFLRYANKLIHNYMDIVSFLRVYLLIFTLLIFCAACQILFLFFFFFFLLLRGRCFPSLPREFSTFFHNDPAAHLQDHCGRCRIRTWDLCPRSLARSHWATTSPYEPL